MLCRRIFRSSFHKKKKKIQNKTVERIRRPVEKRYRGRRLTRYTRVYPTKLRAIKLSGCL